MQRRVLIRGSCWSTLGILPIKIFSEHTGLNATCTTCTCSEWTEKWVPMPSQCDIKFLSSWAKINMCCSGHLENFWVPHSHLFFYSPEAWEQKISQKTGKGIRYTNVQNMNVPWTLWKNKLTSLYSMHLQHLGLHSICWRELSMRPLTQSTFSSDGITQRSQNIEIYHIIMHLHCLHLNHHLLELITLTLARSCGFRTDPW